LFQTQTKFQLTEIIRNFELTSVSNYYGKNNKVDNGFIRFIQQGSSSLFTTMGKAVIRPLGDKSNQCLGMHNQMEKI